MWVEYVVRDPLWTPAQSSLRNYFRTSWTNLLNSRPFLAFAISSFKFNSYSKSIEKKSHANSMSPISKVYVISSELQIAPPSARKITQSRDPGAGNEEQFKKYLTSKKNWPACCASPWLYTYAIVPCRCPLTTTDKGGQMSKWLLQLCDLSQLRKLINWLSDCSLL